MLHTQQESLPPPSSEDKPTLPNGENLPSPKDLLSEVNDTCSDKNEGPPIIISSSAVKEDSSTEEILTCTFLTKYR